MRLTIILFLLFCLSPFALLAQNNYAVKGVAADSVEHAKLFNTSVAVLNAKDSTLVRFTRAGEDGSFLISGLTKGKFILLVAYPDYADYVEHFSLDSTSQVHNFGKINLNPKSRLLKEVLIKGTAAQIKIKGDTTEFNAAAFSIQPNSKVEDLLKQLPGIQVDKDGKITAQGETVSKVLVDGEEFFGDDPTLVTKNIRGDMVDKVQLYDKKSDQATFTGIDDGQKTKTINIKLKEDKKNGYFGKVDVGAGNDDFYQAQVLYNTFKGKKKFSVYGTISNDGKTGLGWEDNQKYGGGSDNVMIMDDGGVGFYFNGGGDDLDSFSGNYDGKGIPIARTGGAHFDNKWNSDKESVNINFKTGSLTVDGTDRTLSQNNFGGGAINSTSNQIFHNYAFRNKLDLTYQVKLDTTSTLKFSLSGTSKTTQSKSNYLSSSSRNDTLLNTSTRNIINNVDSKAFSGSAFYTKKFKKTGRTFSWNVSEVYNESQAKGNLFSDITYYTYNPAASRDSVIDQYKTNRMISSQLNSNMTYTEPLSKGLSLVFNYGLGVDNSTADRKSFNPSSPGVYTVLDSTYSNDYKLNQVSNQGGAFLNYKKGKNTIYFGTKVTDVDFKQINEYTGDIFQRTFINWSPQASFLHKFGPQKSFNIYYNGRTTQPSVDQIQPVLVNTDPLNQVIGNPRLTPSFSNNFRMYYSSYKVLSDQYFSIQGNYSFTTNPIVSSTVTDTTTGKSTSQYVNIGNKSPYNYYTGIYYSRKLPGTSLSLGLNLFTNGNKSYSYSNNELDVINLNTYTARLQISKYVEKKYDFNISFGPNYSYGGTSLHPEINNNGHGLNGNGGFTVYLPGKFQISSDADYQFSSKTQTFDQDYSKLLWNAYFVKTFTKAENFKITLMCNDILNQNSGFNRNISGNMITQDYSTTIKRFFMLTLVWDFSKMGGGVPKK